MFWCLAVLFFYSHLTPDFWFSVCCPFSLVTLITVLLSACVRVQLFPLELFFWTAVLRMHKICLSAASPLSVPAPSSEQHRRLQCSVSVLPFLRFVQSHQKFSTHVPVLFHWLVKGSSIFSCESPAFLHLPSPNCVCFTAPFWSSLCWLYRSFHLAVQAHIVVWITCVCSSPICALLWDTALLGDFIRLTLQKILSFWAADPRGV